MYSFMRLKLECSAHPRVLLSDGGPRSAGWRDHGCPGDSRRRKFDFDFGGPENLGGSRRRAGSDGPEDDRDGLPEWCMDEEDGGMGTFDSSGAFMPMKVTFNGPCGIQDIFKRPFTSLFCSRSLRAYLF